MPFILPFIPLIAAGVGAAGLADTVYNQVNAPGAPAATPASTTPQPQTAATNTSQTVAASSALPTLQSLTGGSLSPEYASQWAGTTTGLGNNPQAAGNIQSAINQFFGLTAPGQSGLTQPGGASPGGNSITDTLTNSLISGQGGGSSLVSGLLNSDTFKGFS